MMSFSPLQRSLDALVATDGAGSWPPGQNLDSKDWPTDLIELSDIAHAAPAHFTVQDNPATDYRANEVRIRENRAWLMERILASGLQLDAVLLAIEALNASSKLGFLACITYLNHLYRWGTIPIVKYAQEEYELIIPDILSQPLHKLNQFFGIQSSGGCLFSLTYCMVDGIAEKLRYSNTAHLDVECPKNVDKFNAERNNGYIFWKVEELAFPFYESIPRFAHSIEQRKDAEAAQILRNGNEALSSAFKFYQKLIRSDEMPQWCWITYAQGFHGWGLDQNDGASGDQALLIRTLDAFCDIPTVTTQSSSSTAWDFLQTWTSFLRGKEAECSIPDIEYSVRHITRCQRSWLRTIRDFNFPAACLGLEESRKELCHTLQLLKIWRMGHLQKAVQFESVVCPERHPMTAGSGSMIGTESAEDSTKAMMAKLSIRMRRRIAATTFRC